MRQLNIFRELHHVCVVVRNLDAAVAYYESLGVGPWRDYPSLEPYELDVKDRKGYLNLRYRYANLDNYQLQLCEPGEGDTPQRRFLEERGEGVFHSVVSPVAACRTAPASPTLIPRSEARG